MSEHVILAKNRTSNLQNIAKTWTVREHWTVRSTSNTGIPLKWKLGKEVFFNICQGWLDFYFIHLFNLCSSISYLELTLSWFVMNFCGLNTAFGKMILLPITSKSVTIRQTLVFFIKQKSVKMKRIDFFFIFKSF